MNLTRRTFAYVVCALALVACGNNGGPAAAQGPPSAQSVADGSSDFTGVQKCPESGSYDKFLAAEQTKSPDQYASDKKTWDQLKAGGANDSYLASYADTSADCGQLSSSSLQGKVADALAIRFKDAASAAAAYKTLQAQFHLTDTEVSQLKAFGGTVQQGSATGLGDNSIVISLSIATVSVYIALWQNKEFEVAVIVGNMPTTTGSAAATKINGRIR